MNLKMFFLKFLRKLFKIITGNKSKGQGFLYDAEGDPRIASDDIYHLLMSTSPCMIARYGSTELACIINYLGTNSSSKSILKYIKGEQSDWWWNPAICNQMQKWSGFFPPTIENLIKFSQMMIDDTKQLDYLGSWGYSEEKMRIFFPTNMKSTLLRYLEPFWTDTPWTRALVGKRVLVVHPFNADIENQYKNNRKKLFDNPNILPEFHLETIKAVQSLGGESNGFKDWFEALSWMKSEIDKRDYDICLLGCGAYGFPLAAHCKRMGKKAIHLGGALQLLFGIKGKRWEDPNYGVKEWGIPYGSYSDLMNEHWIRPGQNTQNSHTKNVEGGCYW